METYKPSIVSNVRSAIDSMNVIVVLLQSDKPIPSDVMEISYPQGTVDEFLKSSKAVVDVSRNRLLRRCDSRRSHDTSEIPCCL